MYKYNQTPQGRYHGPLPVRNFFPLPNAIFDLGLTAEEIAVYAFLMKCEDRRTYTCYPSYKTIGRAIGKSKNTVIKYVNMLEEKGLITKHKTFVVTKDGKAWNGNLMFGIAPIRDAWDVYYYHQMWDRNEQYKLATIETGYRNELKDNLADLLQQIQARQSLPNADYYLFLLRKIKDELQQQKGKMLYGYLPRKMKRLVDFALHEFAKDDVLSEIYAKWNEVNREKLSLYYDTKDKPAVPIERNPELRSLKNMLIRTALSMNFNAQVTVNTARIGFLFSMLAKQIVNSAGKRLDELNKMMPKSDSKERDKIRAKKQAHGQKEGTDGTGIDAEVYDSQAVEGILTMLDYLISLGNQESEQDNEVDIVPEESYDFDNAYAEYLSDEDDGYDEDEEEYFGLSM